jgi:uncharacterized protein with HEPN domain
MRPGIHDSALLADMLEFAERATSYVRGRTRDEYLSNDMLRSAVERVVQIIGEAASKVSPQFRDAHPEVPWRPIIAQRHILVHDYGKLDDDKIWRVATVHVVALVTLLRPLLPPPPPDPFPEPG